jgi:hypothetical protein
MLPVLVADVCASVLRVAAEGRGFPEAAYDECRRGAGSLPPGAKWRLSCAGAIALCLWMATPCAVEMTGGQNFGEAQGSAQHSQDRRTGSQTAALRGDSSELRKIVLTRVVFSLQPPTGDSTPDFVRKMESGPSHRAAVDVIVKDA